MLITIDEHDFLKYSISFINWQQIYINPLTQRMRTK